MTTYGEITDLQNYLKSQVGLNVKIGNEEDVSDNEYPLILLVPDENGLFTSPQEDRMNTFDFNIKIKLIDTNKSTRLIKTLQYMDKILTTINNFSQGKGHVLKEDFITEYAVNTYEVTFVYELKIRLHNS